MSNEIKELIVKITKKSIDKALNIKLEPYRYIEVYSTVSERFLFYKIVFAKGGKFSIEDLQDMLTKIIEH